MRGLAEAVFIAVYAVSFFVMLVCCLFVGTKLLADLLRNWMGDA